MPIPLCGSFLLEMSNLLNNTN